MNNDTNKAEGDLSSLNVQAGADIELVYSNRDEEFVRLDDVKALLATPPATTGASTALPIEIIAALGLFESASIAEAVDAIRTVQRNAFLAPLDDLEEEIKSLHRQLAAEKLRADQGWGRAEAKSRECLDLRERMAGLVSASTAFMPTVLTDERIDEIKDGIGEAHPSVFAASYEAMRAFAREVAAQAGQVAVPEGFVLVPVKPTPKMVDATFNHVHLGSESHNARNKRIYAAMIAAAPSPAKESK